MTLLLCPIKSPFIIILIPLDHLFLLLASSWPLNDRVLPLGMIWLWPGIIALASIRLDTLTPFTDFYALFIRLGFFFLLFNTLHWIFLFFFVLLLLHTFLFYKLLFYWSLFGLILYNLIDFLIIWDLYFCLHIFFTALIRLIYFLLLFLGFANLTIFTDFRFHIFDVIFLIRFLLSLTYLILSFLWLQNIIFCVYFLTWCLWIRYFVIQPLINIFRSILFIFAHFYFPFIDHLHLWISVAALRFFLCVLCWLLFMTRSSWGL